MKQIELLGDHESLSVCCFFETGSCIVTQAGLELTVVAQDGRELIVVAQDGWELTVVAQDGLELTVVAQAGLELTVAAQDGRELSSPLSFSWESKHQTLHLARNSFIQKMS